LPLVDRPDTELEEKAWNNANTIRLYDPPVDGKTPSDGAGLPATSEIVLRDKESKLEGGFTTTVVGWDQVFQTLGEFAVIPGTPFSPLDETPEPEPEKPVKVERKAQPASRAVVKGKADRKRTVKR
jgi:hypothetical protein